MPSVVYKWAMRRRGRRRRTGVPDGKFIALMEACTDLLSTKDYDSINMASIAKRADCSVGALYTRFRSKESLLYRVIASRLSRTRDATLQSLDRSLWPEPSQADIARHIVAQITSHMTARKAAGAVRASVKLATVNPHIRDSLEDYRNATTDVAVRQLSVGSDGPSAPAVRVAMQVVLSTVTDSILHPKPGPMQAGSRRMTDALGNMLIGYLGLDDETAWAGDEADDADVRSEEEPEFDEMPQTGEGEVAVYDPDRRTFRIARRQAAKSVRSPSHSGGKKGQGSSAGPAPTAVAPGTLRIDPDKKELDATAASKRKRRFI